MCIVYIIYALFIYLLVGSLSCHPLMLLTQIETTALLCPWKRWSDHWQISMIYITSGPLPLWGWIIINFQHISFSFPPPTKKTICSWVHWFKRWQTKQCFSYLIPKLVILWFKILYLFERMGRYPPVGCDRIIIPLLHVSIALFLDMIRQKVEGRKHSKWNSRKCLPHVDTLKNRDIIKHCVG